MVYGSPFLSPQIGALRLMLLSVLHRERDAIRRFQSCPDVMAIMCELHVHNL
jgi:hypothetical protein